MSYRLSDKKIPNITALRVLYNEPRRPAIRANAKSTLSEAEKFHSLNDEIIIHPIDPHSRLQLFF